MFAFTGNTSATVDSQSIQLPTLVNNFLLVNKTAGTIGINVYKVKISGSGVVCIAPLNKQLAAGEVYHSDREVVLLPTEQVRLSVSGSVDYDFTLSNLQIDENEQQM